MTVVDKLGYMPAADRLGKWAEIHLAPYIFSKYPPQTIRRHTVAGINVGTKVGAVHHVEGEVVGTMPNPTPEPKQPPKNISIRLPLEEESRDGYRQVRRTVADRLRFVERDYRQGEDESVGREGIGYESFWRPIAGEIGIANGGVEVDGRYSGTRSVVVYHHKTGEKLLTRPAVIRHTDGVVNDTFATELKASKKDARDLAREIHRAKHTIDMQEGEYLIPQRVTVFRVEESWKNDDGSWTTVIYPIARERKNHKWKTVAEGTAVSVSYKRPFKRWTLKNPGFKELLQDNLVDFTKALRQGKRGMVSTKKEPFGDPRQSGDAKELYDRANAGKVKEPVAAK